MDVQVIGFVHMHVNVSRAILVQMEVAVRLPSDSLTQTPNHVDESEGDESPSCQIAPNRLNRIYPRHCQPENNSEKAEDQRAHNVTQPAGQGDDLSLGTRPSSGPAHDHEWQVMVGAQKCVGHAYDNGRKCEGESSF
jgi:hypothetical protein